MNETRRDALVGRVADTLDARSQLTATELSHRDIYQDANELVDAAIAARDAEIRERLLSDEAVRAVSAIEISALNDSVNATKVKFGKAWDLNTDNPRAIVDLRNPYKMSIPVALDAIGLHGDGTGGQG